ncbi:MAG: FCD domain-containing protein [Thalassovita sp.]
MASNQTPEIEQNESERIYDIIRRDIISGELMPLTKLKVSHIREHYNFGAAPVREALARLVGGGFVVQQSQRGFRVRDMSTEDVVDLSKMRILLECEGVRASLENGSDEWESNLVAAYHKLSLAEKRRQSDDQSEDLEERNRAFHDALVAAANSNWLLEMRAHVYAHHERYRYVSRQHSFGKRDTPAEHAAIFEAAIRRDVKETCKHLTRHIDLTTVQAVEAMKRGRSAF